MSNTQKTIIVSAGASGGHIFPAMSVADELRAQGFRCVFLGRGGAFTKKVTDAGYEMIQLPASPWNVRNPIRKVQAVWNLLRAFWRSFRVIHEEKASVVFGTGGYATVAAVLAAKFSGVPTLIQEQNVLPGRANRFLSKWADRVCLSFESSRHYLPFRDGVMVVTGNPIRQKVIDACALKRDESESFKIFITGGSQGAKVLSDVIPDAIDLLPHPVKKLVKVVQQTRLEDVQRVKNAYHDIGVEAVVDNFFDDIENQIVQTNLVIARSGASTVNETSLLGRAAIYVPLRIADGHQVLNAREMEALDAAVVIEQQNFTAEFLAKELEELIVNKDRLSKMEQAAKASGIADAAARVATEVVKLSENDILHLGEELLNDEEKNKG